MQSQQSSLEAQVFCPPRGFGHCNDPGWVCSMHHLEDYGHVRIWNPEIFFVPICASDGSLTHTESFLQMSLGHRGGRPWRDTNRYDTFGLRS